MSLSQNWHKWLVLPLLGLALSARPIGCDYSSITDKFGAEAVARCNEKCPFQNRTGDGHFDLNCGADCSIQQCTVGCSLWKQGLEKSCQTSCNVTSETVVSRELYCVMGCNEALNTYYQKLRDLIGTPSAPALVPDSSTPTSLSLVWEAPDLANLSFLVQWRYEELPGTWQYYSNGSQADRSIIKVWNLQPYTKYRFRVAVFLSERAGWGEPVLSSPSLVMMTRDGGRPASAPGALRAAATGPGRVAISWAPGPFPNGPLIGYVLRLADTQPKVYTAVKDMPASNNTLFYMFQNLAPAREYEVSVSMRNAVGEGPRANLTVTTPPLPTSIPQQPILILGGEQNVLTAPANDMLSDPVELYSTEHTITGVGLDISTDYLFISVSNGYVFRSTLSKKSDSKAILTPETISYKPLDLSVDWLNRHLYVLGEVFYNREGSNSKTSGWEILRCDFDGKNQLVTFSGFTSRPVHFEVDPYNGYIFWAVGGVERGGLYRLDLAHVSNGVRREVRPHQMLRDLRLGPFAVDHADFRLLVAHQRRNNILAVSLDGREVTDFRSNTQTPKFNSARSIAYANGLFYWTNGSEMFTEEYHAQSNSYFHNEYPLVFNMMKIVPRHVLVNLRSCQPIPVPVNPPIGVQSIMGISKAKVSWSPPHLLGHQGSGAWQQWAYHLQLTHLDSGEQINIKGINGTNYLVEHLKQNAEYEVKVAAVTESGSGPWSSSFVSRTFPMSTRALQSRLLWAAGDGLLRTDLAGDSLHTLIHKTHLKNIHITDISWYRDKLYLVTNASTVLWHNMTSHQTGVVPNMDNVGSLAVDWVGKRIYWSNPKQQLITRGNLDCGNREPVPIVTVAKEIKIDSMGAYIYWNTGHAVEAARLNGENKIVYYPAQLFSGKQVMGLTIDLDQKWLYWLVRSYDGSELHKAKTADTIANGENEISRAVVRSWASGGSGPLVYWGGRLLWLREGPSRAVLADARAQYVADLWPAVNTLAVWDPTMHEGCESIIAIPEQIDPSSIKVMGEWNNFSVSWAPVKTVNINNTRIYYDVSLQFANQMTIERTVSSPEVWPPPPPPHSALRVVVRALSPWGAGGAAGVLTRSPAAPPAAPPASRAYVQRNDGGGHPTAVFRWSKPLEENGILRGYEVKIWSESPTAKRTHPPVKLGPTTLEYALSDVVTDATYYFQVRAYTDAGYGPYSETVSTSSNDINPIPRVMISLQESIKIIDLDSGESQTIPKSTGIPVDLAASIHENSVYWVNNLEEIFSSRVDGSGHYKLTSINGSATSMCVDWVSRSVYWSQMEMTSTTLYVVYKADLSLPNSRPKVTRLFALKRPVYSLQVVPLARSLYWYEENNKLGLGVLMTSKVNGSDMRPFFNNSHEKCNCPENPQISRGFVLDMSLADVEVYWIDPWVNQIVASDMRGCNCRIVVDATDKKKYGFTPMSITVDSKYVYWFNSTERNIYYTTKYRSRKVESFSTNFGYKILALDQSNQPYPPKECLYPQTKQMKPKVVSNSDNSITLQLPRVGKPEYCSKLEFEMPATEYTIFYRQYSSGGAQCDRTSCPFITTTDREVDISDLKPFTNYSVHFEVTNFYGKLHEVKPTVGLSTVLQTAAEAPSPAADVRVRVLSPVLARVEWTPQPDLTYELHWKTDDSPALPPNFKEHNTWAAVSAGRGEMSRLSAGSTYSVWVRARSRHSALHADTAPLRLRTAPLPHAPVLARALHDTLILRWAPDKHDNIVQYDIEISKASESNWRSCEHFSKSEWRATGLKPKTKYKMRLRLVYVKNGPPYYWPSDDRISFETKGAVPGAAGPLRVSALGERVLRAHWDEPDPRGHPVSLYRVWGRPLDSAHSENMTLNASEISKTLPEDVDEETKQIVLKEGWSLLYNGTESYWLLGPSWSVGRVSVRVQARNALGWGALGPAADLDASALRRAPQPHPATLLAAAAGLAALAVLLAAPLLFVYNNRGKKKTALESQPHPQITPTRRGPDVELATLRQLPTRHSTNIIYNQGVPVMSCDVSSLPRVSRSQITLTKFLGAGAFGEVFQGVAALGTNTTQTKVAVKTLRKGATDQEKSEFLQEAALMSNFKHEHILALLGVCLDNDPHYIIMELMEEGDLLSYLRTKRAMLYTSESLTLLDLLNMCVDVTTGCRYLEEMHFVHRDLACRNCLVAHRPRGRVVKIGDFGLARDIYKNDYYRKEGEGLLPVRWMAVECLVDGVFSVQSDVWSWAVLCWEVWSLGQQPYPARTNRQVLAYVRAGGTPDQPTNCPHALYSLMQQCWSYSPSDRPSFAQCLALVTSLRDKTSANITLTATPAHYLTLIDDAAVDNRTYLLDENDNACVEEECQSNLLEEPTWLSSGDAASRWSGYERPRHSVVGISPNTLVRPPLLRSHSLRTRPANATVLPLRRAAPQRVSLQLHHDHKTSF